MMKLLSKNIVMAGSLVFSTMCALAGASIAPEILNQPQDQSAAVGGNATFSVAVDQALVKYQWRKAGIAIVKQTNATLLLTNITPNSAGKYSVKITSGTASSISSDAVLTVTPGGPLPVITVQPEDKKAAVKGVATFKVVATSKTPMGYQWLFNGTNIPGATKAIYTKTAIQFTNEGDYSVVVSNWGGSVTSEPAALQVVGELLNPVVLITNVPVGGKIYDPTFVVGGRATDKSGIKQVFCSVNGGEYVAAMGTSNWLSIPMEVSMGANVVKVKAVDIWGNEGVATKTFTRAAATPLTVVVTGGGTVTPDLNGKYYPVGAKFTLQAVATDTNFVFKQWTNSTLTNTLATNTFTMQSNMVLTATFITNPFIARQGDYYGMISDVQNHSGIFSMSAQQSGAYSAKLLIDDSSYSFSGKFDAFCRSYVYLKQAGKPTRLSLWGCDADNVDDEMRGRIYFTTTDSVMAYGFLLTFNTETNPCPYAGQYTYVIPGDATNGYPYGDGYGLLTVQPSGLVRVMGTLADNTPFTSESAISQKGQTPFYASVNKGKESFFGFLSITNGSGSTASSIGVWRYAVTGKYYPKGFVSVPDLAWSAYKAPTEGTPVINLTNGVIVFTGGNLTNSLTNTVTLSAGNQFVVGETNTLAFNPTNGVVQGSFWHPDLKKTVSFSGAVLQSSNVVQGFFLGTDKIGGVKIKNQ